MALHRPTHSDRRGVLRLLTVAVALFTLWGLVASCARNPVTGRHQLSLVSERQEIEIGAQAAEQIIGAIGLVEDEALQEYVSRVGLRLAEESERPQLPWSFAVLDDPTPNAFALPGGYIFVTRGILGLMDSEAELAAVLGHEIAHVTARHSVTAISRAQIAQLGLGLGSVLFPEIGRVAGLAGAGLDLLFLKYGRDAERQADTLGFTYALREGYDVREMDDIFISLARVQEREGRSPLPGWAATHPDPAERVEAVEDRIAGLVGPLETLEVGRADFMAAIDGMVYGDDPRNGFFDDGVFYHPDLAFQIAFPDRWRTQNLPQAVVASSPEQDAIVQLAMGQGSPEEAAKAFLGQRGVQAGEVTTERINGLPAVVAAFQARTEQGLVQGLVGFVALGGHTYAIVGYTPAQRFSRYQPVFADVIGSFARLTDRDILAVRPARIEVIELRARMTAAEFIRRYPSAVDADEILLLNQLPDLDVVLSEGMLYKRVSGGDSVEARALTPLDLAPTL